MKAIQLHAVADIPEQVDIEFSTTGFQGGDAGHGGSATLIVRQEAGESLVESHESRNGTRSVLFSTLGDREIDGLVTALIRPGRALEAARRDA